MAGTDSCRLGRLPSALPAPDGDGSKSGRILRRNHSPERPTCSRAGETGFGFYRLLCAAQWPVCPAKAMRRPIAGKLSRRMSGLRRLRCLVLYRNSTRSGHDRGRNEHETSKAHRRHRYRRIDPAYFAFDLGRFASLEYLKSQQAAIEAFRSEQPLLLAGIFFSSMSQSPRCRCPAPPS